MPFELDSNIKLITRDNILSLWQTAILPTRWIPMCAGPDDLIFWLVSSIHGHLKPNMTCHCKIWSQSWQHLNRYLAWEATLIGATLNTVRIRTSYLVFISTAGAVWETLYHLSHNFTETEYSSSHHNRAIRHLWRILQIYNRCILFTSCNDFLSSSRLIYLTWIFWTIRT